MRVKLLNVRIAFPQLFTPRQVIAGEGRPAYSASFIMEENDENYKLIMDALKKVAEEKWGPEYMKTLKSLFSTDRLCLHNGNNKPEYEGFEGMYYINARAYVKPKVLDRDKTHLTEEAGVIYPGCYVHALVDIWAQDKAPPQGKRINSALGGVQFVKDGDAFAGNAPVSDDEFDEIAMSDDEIVGGKKSDDNIFL